MCIITMSSTTPQGTKVIWCNTIFCPKFGRIIKTFPD